MRFIHVQNNEPTCSKISLCLLLVSVRVRFYHSLDFAMIYNHYRMTKKEKSAMIRDMAVTEAKALLANTCDEKKSTEEHLSSSGGIFCWYNTSDADHVDGLFKMTVNDTAEIYFDAMTGQI